MAQNETWIKHDLMEAVKVQYLDGNLFSMDNAGNLIGVELVRNGVDYSGGGTISANVIRADGATVAVSGALSENRATVVLPQAAYAVPGVLSVIVKLTNSGEVTTIGAVVANVYKSSTDTAVDPGTIIPDIDALIAEIEAAIASIPADYSSLWTSLAPAFNANKSGGYIAGEIVSYNGNVYKFTEYHSGSWNANHVTVVSVGTEVANANIKEINKINYNATGFRINQNTNRRESSGVVWSWDQTYGMYHVVGTSTGYDFYNIFYSTNSMPEGMVAGNRYRISFVVKGTPTEDIKVQMYKNVGTTLTLFREITATKRNQINSHYFDLPSDANGLLVRFYISSGKQYDHYLGVEIVDEPDLDLYQLKNMVRYQVLSFYGGLRDNEAASSLNAAVSDSNYWDSCDDVDKACIGFISSSGGVKDIPDFPLSSGWLITLYSKYFWTDAVGIQYAVDYSNHYTLVRVKRAGSGWDDWTSDGFGNCGMLPNGTDVNAFTKEGSYIVDGSSTYENLPFNGSGYFVVLSFGRWTYQVAVKLSEINKWYVQTLEMNGTGVRVPWTTLTGDGTTYEITQNINRDTIQNTYTISCSPQITTDSNGWLQPTGDQTDRTSAIMAMLNSTGYCHLAPGIYYVSGGIDLPDDATLEGCGQKTVIRLLSSVNSGYIARIGYRNTVRSISFSGGTDAPSNLYTDGTNLGSRHGIVYIGNSDGTEPSYAGSKSACIIDGCWFDNFDGSGLYARNVGGGVNQGLKMIGCTIHHCRVGINIDYRVEYCEFVGNTTYQCYYACINNGGNNVFSSCIFHGVVGWLMDDSNNDRQNNSHGSCVGCTFNHIDNMNHPETLGGGLAVHMINGDSGFVFTGCQFWYGNILIENCKGVTFSDSLFGNSAVSIKATGSYPVFFSNNIFHSAPTELDVTPSSKFNGNYTVTGATVAP